MATDTKVLTAHVPIALVEKVEAMAARLERSRGWVMKQALAAWVDQEEERHRMTLEALKMWTPGASSTTRPFRHGRIASARTNPCRRPWHEDQMDRQGILRSRAVARASAPGRPEAAARVVQQLARAPDRLLDYPRIGEKLDAYAPREVRRIIVGNYELRYEIADATIFILRLWHCRENRSFESDE